MTIALAALTVLVVASVAAWVVSAVFRDSRSRERSWEKKETAWATERQGLLDRIMYLADRPWDVPQQQADENPLPARESFDPLESPIESEYDFYPQGVV